MAAAPAASGSVIGSSSLRVARMNLGSSREVYLRPGDVGAGAAEGAVDAANILKPALSRGEIRCIGATTPAEYRKYIEKDRSLERRFQAIKVDPPGERETIQILLGVKDRYENFHHVEYTREAIEQAAEVGLDLLLLDRQISEPVAGPMHQRGVEQAHDADGHEITLHLVGHLADFALGLAQRRADLPSEHRWRAGQAAEATRAE